MPLRNWNQYDMGLWINIDFAWIEGRMNMKIMDVSYGLSFYMESWIL